MNTTIGSRGPNAAADDMAIDDGKVMLAKMMYNLTVIASHLQPLLIPAQLLVG